MSLSVIVPLLAVVSAGLGYLAKREILTPADRLRDAIGEVHNSLQLYGRQIVNAPIGTSGDYVVASENFRRLSSNLRTALESVRWYPLLHWLRVLKPSRASVLGAADKLSYLALSVPIASANESRGIIKTAGSIEDLLDFKVPLFKSLIEHLESPIDL